jgi:hypothetical protein
MVGEAGLEPATPGLEGRCSIQLSYSPAGYRFPIVPSREFAGVPIVKATANSDLSAGSSVVSQKFDTEFKRYPRA